QPGRLVQPGAAAGRGPAGVLRGQPAPYPRPSGPSGRRPSAVVHRPGAEGVRHRLRIRGRPDGGGSIPRCAAPAAGAGPGRLPRPLHRLDPSGTRAAGSVAVLWGVASALLANVLYSTGFVMEKRALAGLPPLSAGQPARLVRLLAGS